MCSCMYVLGIIRKSHDVVIFINNVCTSSVRQNARMKNSSLFGILFGT
jgi:hypothetical protein